MVTRARKSSEASETAKNKKFLSAISPLQSAELRLEWLKWDCSQSNIYIFGALRDVPIISEFTRTTATAMETSLNKPEFALPQTFITLIPSRLIRQMLPIFLVEF